jgi:hypothetical protein
MAVEWRHDGAADGVAGLAFTGELDAAPTSMGVWPPGSRRSWDGFGTKCLRECSTHGRS